MSAEEAREKTDGATWKLDPRIDKLAGQLGGVPEEDPLSNHRTPQLDSAPQNKEYPNSQVQLVAWSTHVCEHKIPVTLINIYKGKSNRPYGMWFGVSDSRMRAYLDILAHNKLADWVLGSFYCSLIDFGWGS